MAYEDYFDEYDYEPRSRPTTCKFCGKTGLHWENDDGQWQLYETQYKLHNCPKNTVAQHSEGFEDLTK